MANGEFENHARNIAALQELLLRITPIPSIDWTVRLTPGQHGYEAVGVVRLSTALSVEDAKIQWPEEIEQRLSRSPE